jgi:hypothetical protein
MMMIEARQSLTPGGNCGVRQSLTPRGNYGVRTQVRPISRLASAFPLLLFQIRQQPSHLRGNYQHYLVLVTSLEEQAV